MRMGQRDIVYRAAVSRRNVLRGGLGLLALAGLPTLAGCESSGPRPATKGNGAVPALTVDLARADVALSQVDVAPVVNGRRRFGAELYAHDAKIGANWTM